MRRPPAQSVFNLALAALTTVAAIALSPALGRADEPMEVSVYLGSSNDRINRAGRGDDNTETASSFAAGFRAEMPIAASRKRGASTFEWRAYGAMALASRAFEADSASGASEPEQSVRSILKTADAGEFYAGFRFMCPYDLSDDDVPDAAVYARLETGGVTADEGNGDLIDNTFFGLGWERLSGNWQHSFLEGGVGRSDVFARENRAPRYKIRMGLEYALDADRTQDDSIDRQEDESLAAVFLHARVDSDGTEGPDGVRIVLGLRVDAGRVFQNLVETIKGVKE